MLARHASVLIPSVAYAICFAFASVLITVEIPQLFIPKFEFNPQQIGLQFLSNIIGNVIGEQIAGRGSDWWMAWKAKKMGEQRRPQPEFRLWLSYFGYTLTMVGLLVFGIRIQQAPQGEWNVTPLVSIIKPMMTDKCSLFSGRSCNCLGWQSVHHDRSRHVRCRLSHLRISQCGRLCKRHQADVGLHRAFLVPRNAGDCRWQWQWRYHGWHHLCCQLGAHHAAAVERPVVA